MKERKNRLRNILAVAVTLAIVGSSVNIPSAVSFARETAGMDMEQSADNADDEGTQTAEKVVGGPDVLPDSFQLSEDQKTQSAEEQGAGQEQTQPAGSGSQTLSEGEPEGEEETEDIAEESVDLSYFLYQCGGTGVMDKPMLMSEDEGVSALSDTAGAKEAVLAAIKAWDKEVDVSAYQVTTEELTRLYVDIVNENPELFYVGGSIGYTYSPSSMTALTAKPTYNPAYTKDSVQIYNRAFEKAYNEAVPDPDGMTRLQVARACHDYLAQHMCYDESLQKYDAYNAFVEGTAVCQGYSLAYAAMMKKAGIPFGYAVSEEMEHEWNQIKLDGQWYHVDVTWDDPGNSVGYVRYLYFLNSDAKIRGEHEGWVGQTCSSEAYDHAYWQESRVVSAIFAIGNKEYYIICEDNPDIADTKDAWLVCRQVDGTETKLVSVDTIREAGGGLFYMGCYSSLSHYNGKLYYNGAKDIYSVNPSASSVADSKKTVYTYDGAGYLYASFVCGDKIQMLVSSNPNLTDGTVKEVELPAGAIKGVTVVAEPSSIEYGYTAAPKMKAEVTLRDGETGTPEFKWYRITEDGREELISGQTTDTCPADMGLSIGTHTYCVKVTLGDDVVEREVSLTVTGKEQQTGFKFVAASENRTYGEADFVAAVTGNAKGSKVTYRIEDPSVASKA